LDERGRMIACDVNNDLLHAFQILVFEVIEKIDAVDLDGPAKGTRSWWCWRRRDGCCKNPLDLFRALFVQGIFKLCRQFTAKLIQKRHRREALPVIVKRERTQLQAAYAQLLNCSQRRVHSCRL